jgi:hypothetical protein
MSSVKPQARRGLLAVHLAFYLNMGDVVPFGWVQARCRFYGSNPFTSGRGFWGLHPAVVSRHQRGRAACQWWRTVPSRAQLSLDQKARRMRPLRGELLHTPPRPTEHNGG